MSGTRAAGDDPEAEARRLAQDWELRAQSPSRDFFVASHPGWDDPAAWERQARHDADFLLQRLPRPLAGAHLLEIGCGVGRLVPALAPRVASYTGFDIAPSMVAEARARHGAVANARFLEADGLAAPAGARDRRYDVALAHAVFIHCPREVIAALIADCWTLLADGGELRFQLRADPHDDTPLELLPAAAPPAASARAGSAPADAALAEDAAARTDGAAARTEDTAARAEDTVARAEDAAARAVAGQVAEARVAVPASDAPLVDERDYMGAAFRSDEVVPFLAALTGAGGGEIAAVRVDRLHIYVALRRPAAL